MPFALCATGLFALVFTGCERASQKAEPPQHSPESYLNDKTFMTNLVARKAARDDLTKIHMRLATQMKAMVDAKLKELNLGEPTEQNLKKVKVELEKDPEWNSLHARCADAAQAIAENKRDAMKAVRARITPRKSEKKNGDLK